MSKVEELQNQIRQLSPEEHEQLRNWFWDLDWIKWDAQIEADVKSGKLDELVATSRRRYHELLSGEVQGIPGPLVFDKPRAELPLSDEERAEFDHRSACERDRDPGRPAEEVIAEIAKRF